MAVTAQTVAMTMAMAMVVIVAVMWIVSHGAAPEKLGGGLPVRAWCY